MCEQGFGVCTLSTIEAKKPVEEDSQVPIIPDWNLEKMNIGTATPQRNSLSAKLT